MPKKLDGVDPTDVFAPVSIKKQSIFVCLLDGGIYRFEQGKDFKSTPENFRSRASAWFREEYPSKGIRTKIDGKDVLLQIYDMTPEEINRRELKSQQLRERMAMARARRKLEGQREAE